MSDGYFDQEMAEIYDQLGSDTEALSHAVDVLAELAFDGTALEFAVGTGRVALPLQEKGIRVTGIELSKPMVAQLRQKPGGEGMDVTIGDMATTRVEGAFSLVFLVFNTIDNLTTQAAQVACFENAAAHLVPGGRFVVETNVPPVQRIPFGETKRAFALTPDHWGIEEVDIATQEHTSHHIWMKDGVQSQTSIPFRYAWPAEMDLMARIAGLELESRWEDWRKTPFTRTSMRHISVWRKPPQ
ncbi:MAG: class I SAM-dependent methyltransferase [Pseudomonadota bacterium]